jgi:hypothetical protein
MKFGFEGLYFVYDRIFIMFKTNEKDFGHFYHDTRVDARFTRRKTCIFDCSLRLNFSRKRHFATKILLVA